MAEKWEMFIDKIARPYGWNFRKGLVRGYGIAL